MHRVKQDVVVLYSLRTGSTLNGKLHVTFAYEMRGVNSDLG